MIELLAVASLILWGLAWARLERQAVAIQALSALAAEHATLKLDFERTAARLVTALEESEWWEADTELRLVELEAGLESARQCGATMKAMRHRWN